MYVQFGATRACFVTKQGQESINRKIYNLEHRNRRGHSNFFYERVNRITSRDNSPICDTDFARLVRYDRFPSLLYGSGAIFLKIGLWYGGAATSCIPIPSVFTICTTRFVFELFFVGSLFDIKAIFFGKNQRFR